MHAIDILKMAGAGQQQVKLFNLTISSSAASDGIHVASATSTYNLNAIGSGATSPVVANTPWTWLLIGLNSDYQVRATVQSGSTPNRGDSLNSWLALSSDRSWGLRLSDTVTNDDSSVVLIEIRRVVDSVVIKSASITLNCHITG